MTITEDLQKEIADDIALCESFTDVKGSESLYGVLVAKYSSIDQNFAKYLSTNGKATVLGSEFDYRQELKTIAAKLRMWLLPVAVPNVKDISSLSYKEKVKAFIICAEDIKKTEFYPAGNGFPFSVIRGPKFDAWLSEINIFNERHLKNHPLYKCINTTFLHRNNSHKTYNDMLGFLRALYTDDEFWNENYNSKVDDIKKPKSIEELLSEDIIRCQKYISDPRNETLGRQLYLEITGRYDSIIKNFGLNLYSYYSEQHFYDPDISITTVIYNLKLLVQKMISYQSFKYSEYEKIKKEEQKELSNKVFIVHGHDDAAKEIMARILEKAKFEAIILHEKASSGKTIIEKIEANTDVSFAVVLYTPCDLGRDREADIESEKYRARQNVIFEHGYLIGKLGRSRVCAFVKGDIETPGDISGVVYIPMDTSGGWKAELAKEMISAGLSFDMNNLFT